MTEKDIKESKEQTHHLEAKLNLPAEREACLLPVSMLVGAHYLHQNV